MELSQPRPYDSEGRKPTHDFLSLYSHSTPQLDPRPPSQGNFLETHDFLQPLERVGKGFAKEENVVTVEVPERPPVQPVEHVLPGGIGTYSISHVNSFSPLRSPKVEGVVFAVAQTSSNDRINNDNSNSSSYGGSGFTLWEQSAAKKGKTGKENTRNNLGVVEATAGGAGQWGSSSERPSQSSSSNHHGNFSSISSTQVSRSHSFMEMIKSAKGSSSNHEDELEEEDHSALKKEISSVSINPKEVRVKVDGKSSDQKANTPRSKHSATEQRRRSKINDRFQMLRQLIPHGDQKRDKASFLLEVIEYVQFLQEKVQKYEGHYPGWNNEQTKLIPWRDNSVQGVNSGPGPASLTFSTKFDEKPLLVSPTVPRSAPNPVQSDIITHNGMSFPTARNGGVVHQPVPLRLQSDVVNTSAQPQSQSCEMQSCAMVNGDKVKEEDLTVEDGIINISSAYSQRLLTTLTQALHCSGIDLSKATISVQIELGKRAKHRTTPATSITKDNEISPCNLGMKHSRAPITEEPELAQKKLKTSKN